MVRKKTKFGLVVLKNISVRKVAAIMIKYCVAAIGVFQVVCSNDMREQIAAAIIGNQSGINPNLIQSEYEYESKRIS